MAPSFRAPLLAAALLLPLSAEAVERLHVAFVGDSLAYGAGDEERKGLAGRLEPELQRRGIESLVTTNLARNGATTGDVAALLRVPATREKLAAADAIVLSAGANDVRGPLLQRRGSSLPLTVVEQVLTNLRKCVAELHSINPTARILILGAYAPVHDERTAVLLRPLVVLWDAALEAQFASDSLVSIVRMSDIVDRPGRLSSIDSFHPGGNAYQQTAARIAALLGPTASERSAERITLRLRDADLRDVVIALARMTGTSVAIDPGVTGRVTIDLVDVPAAQALDLILAQHGLARVTEGAMARVQRLVR